MKVRLNLATSPLESKRRFTVSSSLLGTLAILGFFFLSWNAYSVWRADKVVRARQAALQNQIAALQQQRQAPPARRLSKCSHPAKGFSLDQDFHGPGKYPPRRGPRCEHRTQAGGR